MAKTILIALALLALSGCGAAPHVPDYSNNVGNLPYPAGTCFAFNVPIKDRSIAYWPDSYESRDNASNLPPKGRYVFVVAVDIKDLTPVPCK